MRFATYNIRHGAPPGRRADLRRMSAAIGSLGADVIALQEVDRRVVRSMFRDQARAAARSAGLVHRFAAARSLGLLGQYGNALLLPAGPVDLSIRPLHSVGEPRVALFARVRIAEIAATVVCTHLQNSTRPGPGGAPAQLDELLLELRHWPLPWVLMGDLNLDADQVLPRFDAAGLESVPSGPTFPSDAPRARIDWIGVRGFRIGRTEVPRLDASDHLPLVTELTPEGVS